jgi:phospholipid/cholesterol/gamma-HCH transport system permease protein
MGTEAIGVDSPPGTALRWLEAIGRKTRETLADVGSISRFLRETAVAFRDVGTWRPEVMLQARRLGVDSLPIGLFIAAFTGIVLALLASYSFTGAVPMYFVGTLVGKTVTLELAPVLTGLALAGRVGANIAAEVGTMQVTEQIDALETLAYDPVAYLVVPRLIAAIIMLPALVVFADVCGVLAGMFAAVLVADVQMSEFMEGVRLGFEHFQVTYSLIKATLFGAAIAFLCTYEGYVTGAGAEGVGKATAKAVVVSSIWILVLDMFTALLLAPYLQG